MAKLQDTLDKMFGQLNIAQTQLPEYFETGLNPSKRLRPYQEECLDWRQRHHPAGRHCWRQRGCRCGIGGDEGRAGQRRCAAAAPGGAPCDL